MWRRRPRSGTPAPSQPAPSERNLRWLLALRLVVVTTLFMGTLIIQTASRTILPLSNFYAIFLGVYGLSLAYLVLFVLGVPTRLQAVLQLGGDIAIVTALIYTTGGPFSPFSFLYLIVIVVGATLLRGGALAVAGVSAVVYGALVDLMVFGLIPVPPNLVGEQVVLPTQRVVFQLVIHLGGFVLVALLVSYLGESLRTAHHRLEEERERAARFAALTDHVVRSVTAGILAMDREGRVLHLNPAGARILHIAASEDVTGRDVASVMPLEGRTWEGLLARSRIHGLLRFDARLVPAEVRLGLTLGPLADERGERVGFMINFQDLSEVEREVERQRLQERMAAVGEMAARLAHEIKNPLASISGSAQMLTALGQLEPTEKRLLRIVVDESRRLSGILDDFLDFARHRRAGRGTCELVEMLGDCLDLLRRSPETRPDHRLVLEGPEELVVAGDEHQLRQVFWNLSRNALQAMPEGGELRITLERRPGLAVMTWRDTGIGMSEEVRRSAFEPFTTTRAEGSGLGLAVVYAAVDEHGGTVDIDSSPGRGTAVRVELPCDEVPP